MAERMVVMRGALARHPLALTWAVAVLAALIAVGLGLGSVTRGQVTPFDEGAHFDYVVKIAKNGELPPRNDLLGPDAINALSCDGAGGIYWNLPCGSTPADLPLAPYKGMSYVTPYVPTYYLLQAAPTAVLHAAKPSATWIGAARYTQVLWIACLALLAVAAVRLLGGSRVVALLAALLATCNPLVILQSSHVTNDGLALPATLLPIVIWLALRGRSVQWRLGLALAAAVFALTVKETTVAAFVIVLALELWAPGTTRVSAKGRWLRVLGAAASAAVAYLLIAYIADPFIRGAKPKLPFVDDFLRQVEPSRIDYLGHVLAGGLQSLVDPTGPLSTALPTAFATLVGAWAFGGCAYAASRLKGLASLQAVDIVRVGALFGLIVVPVLLGVQLLATHQPLWFTPRYVAPAMVVGIVGVAVGMGRRAVWPALAVTAALVAQSYVLVLTP